MERYEVGEAWPVRGDENPETREFFHDYNLGMLQNDFHFEEPWSPDIVTNGSVHRYRPGGDTLLDPFSFSDEGLHIRSTRLTDPLMIERNGGMPWVSGVLSGYKSPFFRLDNNQSMTVRARLPEGQGLWPAFWGLPLFDLGKWPEDYRGSILPEVDAMEFINREGKNVFHTTTHTYNQARRSSSSTLTARAHKHTCPADVDFTRDFHHYHLMRTDLQILFGLDGVIIDQHDMFLDEVMQGTWSMLLNTAVGGGWPGAPDDTTPDSADFVISCIDKIDLAKAKDTNPNKDLIRSLEEMRHDIDTCLDEKFKARLSNLR